MTSSKGYAAMLERLYEQPKFAVVQTNTSITFAASVLWPAVRNPIDRIVGGVASTAPAGIITVCRPLRDEFKKRGDDWVV